jgi:acetolactate synthase-1/2/3 large subunit
MEKSVVMSPPVADAARSGGEHVVDALLAHGVERVFCVPGESYLAVLDALYDHRDRITLVTCRHESGAGFMAAATAQLEGRPGVCCVTRGPGATNASIALHVARQASLPLVMLVGQVARGHLGREAFQETDLEAFLAPLVKHVEQVSVSEAIPGAMARAFQRARSGRPGPVVLALPEDVLAERAVAAPEVPRALVRRGLTHTQLEIILRLLREARRPLLVFGGSTASDVACRDLEQFARRNLLPVAVSFRRQDAFDNEHPSYAGYLGFNAHEALWELAGEADCVLVIGARLDEPTTRSYTLFRDERPRTLIHVYPNEEELGRNYAPDLGICADPGEAIAAFAASEVDNAGAREGWYRRVRQAWLDAATPPPACGRLDPGAVMAELDRRLPADTIVTLDAGNFTLWPQRYRRYRRPGRLLAPINGAMGYAVPAAVAASLARPGRTVLGCVGDGGMLMTGMELATAVRHGATPLILVFNNGRYGTIETHQDRRYPGRRIGNELSNPDFGALARAFGLFGARVTDTAGFAEALPAAVAAGSAAVIELVLEDAA